MITFTIYGFAISYQLTINKRITDNTNIDMKIIQISDTHFLDNYEDEKYLELINDINDLNPDIVIFTGDMFEVDSINISLQEKVTDFFLEISCSNKYAVLGNHDYSNEVKTDTTKEILMDSGFTILVNENTELTLNDKTINIIGLDDLMMGDANYDDVLSTSYDYDFNLVLSHEPDTFDTVKTYDIFAMYAGHSHGGQVRLPFIGEIYNVPGAKIYNDRYTYEEETHLYVSFGLGETIIPIRFFNPRSIEYYEYS